MEATLALRLQRLRASVQRCAAAAGRTVDSITVVAVSKGQSAATIAAAVALEQRHFGENYLQEALPKLAELQSPGLVWHYIGRLQANKTRPVAEHFDWVHTVERLQIAQRLSAQRPARLPALNVCVQVNVAGDPGKAGVAPDAAEALARQLTPLPGLKVRGLMCMLPEGLDSARQHRYFAAMQALLGRLQSLDPAIDTLSMGMSGDYPQAIANGATMLRVGTAIFGARA